MALIMICDLCKVKIENPKVLTNSREYCDTCLDVLSESENKGFIRAAEKYDKAVVCQVSILYLLEYLEEHQLESFKKSFGTQGLELLDKALSK